MGGKRAQAAQEIKIPFEGTQGAGWKQCELAPHGGKHLWIYTGIETHGNLRQALFRHLIVQHPSRAIFDTFADYFQ